MSKSKVFCFLSCVLLLVVLVLPSSASPSPDDSLILSYPLSPDYPVAPLISAPYRLYYGIDNGTSFTPLSSLSISNQAVVNNTVYRLIRRNLKSEGSYYSCFMGYGYQVSVVPNSVINLTWSGFTVQRNNGSSGSPDSGYTYPSSTLTSNSSFSPYSSTVRPSFYVYDSSFNILAGPFSPASGSAEFVVDSSASALIFGFYTTLNTNASYTYSFCGWEMSLSDAKLTYTITVPETTEDLLRTTNSLLSSGNSTRSHIDSDMHQVITILQDMSTSAANDPMSQFEGKYLEQMGDQLTGVEGMMSPSNPALPNGGDFVGFADDMQKGFGVNGSSFNASDFSSAAGSFSGSASISEGGPWEFFSQSVADSLSGGASSIGLDDDDYIYAWLEQSERRYGLWASSSP